MHHASAAYQCPSACRVDGSKRPPGCTCAPLNRVVIWHHSAWCYVWGPAASLFALPSALMWRSSMADNSACACRGKSSGDCDIDLPRHMYSSCSAAPPTICPPPLKFVSWCFWAALSDQADWGRCSVVGGYRSPPLLRHCCSIGIFFMLLAGPRSEFVISGRIVQKVNNRISKFPAYENPKDGLSPQRSEERAYKLVWRQLRRLPPPHPAPPPPPPSMRKPWIPNIR